MPELEFRLLGPIEVRSGHGTVKVGGVNPRSVLAALLLQPNRVVSLEQLVAAVWGEHPPAPAGTYAQNLVSALRRAFRGAQVVDELIIRKGSGYLIKVEADQVDVEVFGRGVAHADGLVAAGDEHGAVKELVAALELWRGVALDGLTSPYFRPVVKRLEERRLQAWEQRIRLEVSLGRHADMIAELVELADSHPFHESFHSLLMLVLYWAGRRAEALRAYHEARRVLVDELGLEPSQQLQRLHDAILRADDRAVETIAEELGCSPAIG